MPQQVTLNYKSIETNCGVKKRSQRVTSKLRCQKATSKDDVKRRRQKASSKVTPKCDVKKLSQNARESDVKWRR